MKWITDEARLLAQSLEQHPERWNPVTNRTAVHATENVRITVLVGVEAKIGTAKIPLGLYGSYLVREAVNKHVFDKEKRRIEKLRIEDENKIKVVVARVAFGVPAEEPHSPIFKAQLYTVPNTTLAPNQYATHLRFRRYKQVGEELIVDDNS